MNVVKNKETKCKNENYDIGKRQYDVNSWNMKKLTMFYPWFEDVAYAEWMANVCFS